MIKGYYLETIYPRFCVYRVLILSNSTLTTYQATVNRNEKPEDYFKDGYIDLGGVKY